MVKPPRASAGGLQTCEYLVNPLDTPYWEGFTGDTSRIRQRTSGPLMATPKIRLSSSQAEDLYAVCSLGPALLSKVASAVSALPPTIRKDKVQVAIAAIAGAEKASLIRRVVFGLATVYRRNFDDVSSLLNHVMVPHSWTDKDRADWHACIEPLEQIMSSNAITLSAKAADLSFDVERFCLGARIITDVRPVFDKERGNIVGTTIRQTMRLEYMANDGTVTSLSIGLDASDLVRIRQACEDAIHKADVAAKTMQSIGSGEVIISGEDDDE